MPTTRASPVLGRQRNPALPMSSAHADVSRIKSKNEAAQHFEGGDPKRRLGAVPTDRQPAIVSAGRHPAKPNPRCTSADCPTPNQ